MVRVALVGLPVFNARAYLMTLVSVAVIGIYRRGSNPAVVALRFQPLGFSDGSVLASDQFTRVGPPQSRS